MPLLTISEKSRTRSYGLLSSRVSQALTEAAKAQRQFTEEEIEVLTEGLELLSKFIIGSRLVEGDDFKDGLRPTADTLRAYRYAMTTLLMLEDVHQDSEVSNVLTTLRQKLSDVVMAKTTQVIKIEELTMLRDFFTVLATALCDDLVRLRLEGRAAGQSVNHFSQSVRA
jgi:hypothetical protein